MAKQKQQPSEADDKVRTKKHQEFLLYKFSEDETKHIGLDLARSNQEKNRLELEKTRIVASLKAQVTDCEALISKYSRWLSEGYDYRMIECETRYHVPEQGIKRTTRLDTGEIVKQVKMEPHELQEQLFPEPSEQSKTNGEARA